MPKVIPPFLFWAKGFARKAEVLRIAKLTGHHRKWVATTLMEFYEWAEEQTINGTLPNLDVRFLSEVCPETDDAFWEAVVRVGWLDVSPDALLIPNFERWLGHGAKRRWQEREGKREQRDRVFQRGNAGKLGGFCPADVRTEKEEEKEKEKSPPKAPRAPREKTPPSEEPEVLIPPALDTETFRAAWATWLEYRKEIRKPLSPRSQNTRLKMLGQHGEAVAIEAIDTSIANGWVGLFPGKADEHDPKSGTARRNGQPVGPARIRAQPGKYDGLGEEAPPAA